MPPSGTTVRVEMTGDQPFTFTREGASAMHLALHRLLQLPTDDGEHYTALRSDAQENDMPTIDPTRWGPRKQMNILIPSYLKNKFREKAEKNGHTMSDLIAAWMLNYVEEDNE